jgi:hypothetical protein
MRISRTGKAARLFFAASLILSFDLSPALAGGMARPGGGFLAHPGAFPAHGHPGGSPGTSRGGWNWRNRTGFVRGFRNPWFPGQAGPFGWGFWPSYGYANAPAGSGGDAPVVISAPSIAVYAGADPAGYQAGPEGGCVIHKLLYDRDDKYVGERRFSEC